MDCVAFESVAIDAYAAKTAWDGAAAELVHTMLERWHLTPGSAFIGGEAASVLEVTTRDGEPAVLKVGFPHVEAVGEALALEAWGTGLCPRVLRQDPWTWSLLLERIEPGTRLSEHPVPAAEALAAASDVFERFVDVPVPAGVPTLADIMAGYLSNAHGRLEGQHRDLESLGVRELVEAGLTDAAALAETAGTDYFLHGDYNPGNLLLDTSSGTERWRVIDPKPMSGDREFDLWPLVEQLGSPWTKSDPAAVLASQLRLVTERVGCDYGRAARWAFARSALDVTWYLEDGNHEASVAAARKVKIAERLQRILSA